MMARKVYVDVDARFNKEGGMIPKRIIWEDGRTFDIQRVLDVRQAASLKAGGTGIRYTCRVWDKEIYLFLEEDRWFLEGS